MAHPDHDEIVELRARLVVVQTYLKLLNVELAVNPFVQPSIVEHLDRAENHVREIDSLISQLSGPQPARAAFSQN